MERQQWLAAVAGAGSAALLVGAFAFQYIGGLAPCHLCLLQRWPHGVAVIAALVFLVAPNRWLARIAALVVAIGAGIAVYHVGVEQAWWPGPTSCVAPDPGAMSAGDLMNQILNTPVVLCDQIAWSLWGVSMAGWNAILSALLALLWLAAGRAGAQASSSASQ
ncbi:disulfide bond formation protein B [Amaricoccus solimangrovi]|uniref:Disulfide bond formation protein B n=2 Tax=Amaricoccus solimangrovi TaxID=2589815 RepID=A0A501WDT6_9RHOB|nr:disulfide bond formation protein B [Amaricoccus solimangrovi]